MIASRNNCISFSLYGAARFTAIRVNSCAAKAAFVSGWRGRPEGAMPTRCAGESRSDSSPSATRRHHNREAIAATARRSWSRVSAHTQLTLHIRATACFFHHYLGIGQTRRWRSKPLTKIAGIGRAGQTCSQAPQPMHAPLSTTGKPSTM